MPIKSKLNEIFSQLKIDAANDDLNTTNLPLNYSLQLSSLMCAWPKLLDEIEVAIDEKNENYLEVLMNLQTNLYAKISSQYVKSQLHMAEQSWFIQHEDGIVHLNGVEEDYTLVKLEHIARMASKGLFDDDNNSSTLGKALNLIKNISDNPLRKDQADTILELHRENDT